jgi:hypothetical protein
VGFAAITLFYFCCLFRYRLSPETFGYALVEDVGEIRNEHRILVGKPVGKRQYGIPKRK